MFVEIPRKYAIEEEDDAHAQGVIHRLSGALLVLSGVLDGDDRRHESDVKDDEIYRHPIIVVQIVGDSKIGAVEQFYDEISAQWQ